jgi:hypothetical protein
VKKQSQYIDGIYNYCDRWCERCVFTSHCRNFEGTRSLSPEEQDINNKAFWDKIAKNFEDAIKLLHKAAEKYGIDLNNISKEETEEYSRKEKRDKTVAKNHPLAKDTMLYITKGRKLLENEELMKDKAGELIRNFEMGIQSEEQLSGGAATIKDCQEIISWYLHFIHLKFMRALMGKMEDDGWEEANGFQRDCDGSAKIAMIGIDRSIEAWTLLLQFIPAAEDDIIELLALLQKARRMAVAEFPKARKFIRPGFDEQ